jgi:phosphoribosyl 1,2-cyclic phosphate phosphodiesterase
MKITFLGTGTSHGLPYIGCGCAVCTSADPHNKRLRCSIIVENDAADTRILVDTTPDLRQQFLRAGISWLSAVLWTHSHNDHIIGLDDLRRITDEQGYLNGYANEATLEHLDRVFDYAFVPDRNHAGFPRLIAHTLESFHSFTAGDLEITPIPIMHGRQEICAYRFEDGKSTFVYATDCSHIPDGSWKYLANADALVLDALRPEPHPTHFSLAQALSAIEKLQPKQAFLTHFAHDMDHSAISALLPQNVQMAFDTQTVTL